MTTFVIQRRYHFEAAHFLPHVPDHHKCKRLHGHNYEFEVFVGGELARGWVLDFWELDAIVQPLIDKLDHRLLNDIAGLDNPTAEVIADYLARRIQEELLFRPGEDARGLAVKMLKVFETKDACAIVFPGPVKDDPRFAPSEREFINA